MCLVVRVRQTGGIISKLVALSKWIVCPPSFFCWPPTTGICWKYCVRNWERPRVG